MDKKLISVMIPCYNEVENVGPISEAVIEVFENQLPDYDYYIMFIDNASNDGTRDILEQLCASNKKIRAIFNVTNFGQFNSPFYGICQTTGDCTISMACDFQDPVELIPRFVEEWEKGHKIVSAIKTSSKEPAIIYLCRTIYYKMIKNMSDVKMIEHFTGFGLYDKTFVAIMRELKDPIPFLRGVVAEYGDGFNRTTVEFEQPKRKYGKTKNNFYSLYDAAMLSFTSYTKVGLRLATFIGFACSALSFLIGIAYLVLKLIFWDFFAIGYAPIMIGVFMLGGIQLCFIGFMGEYILNINTRIINRPIVVEERRINFDEDMTK